MFYYLYLVVDVWCRKIVGWAVHEFESPEVAAALIQDAVQREGESYRTGTWISEAVHERVGDAYHYREIDLLTVKGKRQPVRVFELLQERGKASDRSSELKRVFEEGLSFYRQKKWGQAEQAFGFLKEKFHDEISEIFLRRIALSRLQAPPRAWDGVFDLSLT